MNEEIKVKLKKSQINTTNELLLQMLQKNRSEFVPLTILTKNEEYEFSYNIKGLQPWNEIYLLSNVIKYQTLINCYETLINTNTFQYSLAPSNLYLDFNKDVKILRREIVFESDLSQSEKVRAFLALIGTTLNNKYAYDNYFYGGTSLLMRSKITKKFANLKTLDSILLTLKQELSQINKQLNSNIVEVSKTKFENLKYYTFFIVIVTFIISLTSIYFGLIKLNEIKVFNSVNELFIEKNYSEITKVLHNQNVKNMPPATKYILAYASLKNENLPEEKFNNVVSDLTTTDANQSLEFWDYLGLDDYENAIECASAQHNVAYELYAQRRYKVFVNNDANLKSNEKDIKIAQIETKIRSLAKELNINLDQEGV